MSLRQEIEVATPALRRLAQALALPGRAGDAGCGDDMVHETVLRALRHESPAPGLSIRNWLYANLIGINRQRVRAEAGQAGQSLRHGNASGGRERTRRTVSRFAADATQSALQQLDLEEREVLLLVVLEGVGYSHAAMILGLPRPVLIARLARARASLAARLDGDAPRASAAPAAHLRLVR